MKTEASHLLLFLAIGCVLLGGNMNKEHFDGHCRLEVQDVSSTAIYFRWNDLSEDEKWADVMNINAYIEEKVNGDWTVVGVCPYRDLHFTLWGCNIADGRNHFYRLRVNVAIPDERNADISRIIPVGSSTASIRVDKEEL